MRIGTPVVVIAGLVVVLVGAALPSYGGELSSTVTGERMHGSPPDDISLPDRPPITSPGFPSELAGKCLTWQDCQEYCESHQSVPGCNSLIDKPDASKLLIDAVDSGDRAKVEELLAQGAKADTSNAYGETPLHFALDEKIAVMLIAHGADVNARNELDMTPLHYAVLSNKPRVVELLITHGADVNAVDSNGFTVLDWAIAKDKAGMATLLKSHGAQEKGRLIRRGL